MLLYATLSLWYTALLYSTFSLHCTSLWYPLFLLCSFTVPFLYATLLYGTLSLCYAPSSARWEVFKSVQDRLATTEHFEHQARLRPVSERPIWVCLSAQSLLGDRQVPSFPNRELNFQFYYYIRLETMETTQKVSKLFRTRSARLTPLVLRRLGANLGLAKKPEPAHL